MNIIRELEYLFSEEGLRIGAQLGEEKTPEWPFVAFQQGGVVYKKDREIFFTSVISERATGSRFTVRVFVLTSANLDVNYMQTWKYYDIYFLPVHQKESLFLRISLFKHIQQITGTHYLLENYRMYVWGAQLLAKGFEFISLPFNRVPLKLHLKFLRNWNFSVSALTVDTSLTQHVSHFLLKVIILWLMC